MKIAKLERPNWIVLPAVSLTMAYGGVVACWFIFIACTLSAAPIFHEGPFRQISTTSYLVFSGANVALVLWLLLSVTNARRAARGVRRGQLAGIAGSLIFVAFLQSGAQALHHDLNPEDRTDPKAIAAFIADHEEEDRQVISCVRDALHKGFPGVREALWRDGLVYEHEGWLSHRLEVSPGEASLQIYGMQSPLPPIDEGPWALESTRDRHITALTVPLPLDDRELQRLQGVVQTLPHAELPSRR